MEFEGKYNIRSPAVKRLMREACELKDATEEFCARPLEDNLFEWHFTVQGPPGTEFEGGIYHGRILLPTEYPMKPPNIILLTPNGRFEVNNKICLSISGHHPETWQPSWSIRTALLALIAFMPTPGSGTIGSLDYTPEERKVLAKRSQEWQCTSCGKIISLLAPPKTAHLKDSSSGKPEPSTTKHELKGEELTDETEVDTLLSPASERRISEITAAALSENVLSSIASEGDAVPNESQQHITHRQIVTNNLLPTQVGRAVGNTQEGVSANHQSDLLIFFLVCAIAVLLYRRIFLL